MSTRTSYYRNRIISITVEFSDDLPHGPYGAFLSETNIKMSISEKFSFGELAKEVENFVWKDAATNPSFRKTATYHLGDISVKGKPVALEQFVSQSMKTGDIASALLTCTSNCGGKLMCVIL